MKSIITIIIFLTVFCGCSNQGNKFKGVWIDKEFTEGHPTDIIINIIDKGYLVKYRDDRGVDYHSFKEVGQLKENSIFINESIKLSLINDNTLLFNNREFIKAGENEEDEKHI